jgi:hypothetical protein
MELQPVGCGIEEVGETVAGHLDAVPCRIGKELQARAGTVKQEGGHVDQPSAALWLMSLSTASVAR